MQQTIIQLIKEIDNNENKSLAEAVLSLINLFWFSDL